LDALLKENGTGYFAGNSIGVADVTLYGYINNLKGREHVPEKLFCKYENIAKLYQLVDENPKIKAWNDAHKKK